MGHALADSSPEEVIAILNRRRHMMAIGVLGGIILAVVVAFAAVAAMYSGEPTGAKPIPGATK